MTNPTNPSTIHQHDLTNILQPFRDPQDARTIATRFAPSLNIAKGTVLGRITAQQEVVAIDLSAGNDPTAGTWSITLGSATTEVLAWNASAADVQAALEEIDAIGYGNVSVVKAGFVYTVTFAASLGNVDNLTINWSGTLTGATSVTATVSTAGRDGSNYLAAYNNGNSNGTETAVGIAVYSFCTDANGNIFLNSDNNTTPSLVNPIHNSLPVFVAGTFRTSDLTGWDANAAADLNAVTVEPGIIRIP